MYRLSRIINEIYHKFLPLAENSRVQLSLDFPDTSQEVSNPDVVKTDLEQHLSSAIERTKDGQITISIRQHKIQITDTGTILSKPVCALMTNSRIQVKSRVGFGTTVTINLTPKPKSTK